MKNTFNYILIFSLFLISLNGFWAYSNDRCISFQRGQVIAANFCGNTILVLSSLLILLASYFLYLFYISKKNQDKNIVKKVDDTKRF